MESLRNRPLYRSTTTDLGLNGAAGPPYVDSSATAHGGRDVRTSVEGATDRVAVSMFEIVILLLVSLVGFAGILYATTAGAGTGPDSASYVMAARNLLAGHGLSVASPQTGEPVPMTHFPPLFSWMLAGIGFFIHDPLAAARWLNAFLFAANIFMLGYAFRRMGASQLLALSCALGMLTSLPMIFVHTWVLSEALFFFLAFLGLILLSEFITYPSMAFLIAASAALALAWTARYVGVTLALAAGISLLLFTQARWLNRIGYAAMMGGIVALPIAVVVLRNHATGGSMTDRQMVIHPVVTMQYLWLSLEKIATWLVPSVVPSYLQRGLALVLIAFAVFPLYRMLGSKTQNRRIINLHKVVLTFTLCYLAVLVATLIFFDADIRIDDRDLSPFYLCGLVLVECQFALLVNSGRRAFQSFAAVALVLALLVSAPRAAKLIAATHATGLGFLREHWKAAEFTKAIQGLDPADTIVSDSTAGVFFLSGKTALALPYKVDAHTTTANTHYSEEMAELGTRVSRGKSDFVFFKTYGDVQAEADLIQSFRLNLVESTPDGNIYRTP